MASAQGDISLPQTSPIKPFVLSSGAAEFRPMCRRGVPPFFQPPHFPAHIPNSGLPLSPLGLPVPVNTPTSPSQPVQSFFVPPTPIPPYPPPQLVVQQQRTRNRSRPQNKNERKETKVEGDQEMNNNNNNEKITSYQYSLGPNGGTKQKTPMSQIAELARYNRLCHQYKLLNEAGPAHEKVFSVNLILTDRESYVGKGASIKKAQQDAARIALAKSKLPRPTSRNINTHFINRQPRLAGQNALTPTVLLNAIGHKYGSVPVYTPLENTCQPPYPPFMKCNDGRYMRPPIACVPLRVFRVLLKLGEDEFIGCGNSRQCAKHDAANKACHFLKAQGFDCDILNECSRSSSREKVEQNGENEGKCDDNPETVATLAVDEFIANQLKTKSPISLVHEIALSRKLDVTFEILSEVGPAHDRVFSVRCQLANSLQILNKTGQGPSKREAKHAACIAMIHELAKIGPLVLTPSEFRRPRVPKEVKRKTIIKDVKMDPNYGQQINPVSRLIQIMQIKQEKEPNFVLVAETGMARYKEFTVQVTVGSKTCTGNGPNKKLAKRAAAESMLSELGYAKPLPQPGRSVLKQNSSGMFEVFNADDLIESNSQSASPEPEQNSEIAKRKVTFRIEESKKKESGAIPSSVVFMAPRSPSKRNKHQPKADSEEMIKLAKEVLTNVKYKVNDEQNLVKDNEDSSKEVSEVWPLDQQNAVSSKHQLAYLSTLMKFNVQYTDFPKQSVSCGAEYLTLVSVGVSPPLVCHGSGSSVEGAQLDAAYTALLKLAKNEENLNLSDGSNDNVTAVEG